MPDAEAVVFAPELVHLLRIGEAILASEYIGNFNLLIEAVECQSIVANQEPDRLDADASRASDQEALLRPHPAVELHLLARPCVTPAIGTDCLPLRVKAATVRIGRDKPAPNRLDEATFE